MGAMAGVAAALVVIAGLTVVLVHTAGRSASTTSATSFGNRAASPAAAAGTTVASSPTTVPGDLGDLGDLGDQSDPVVVAGLVRSAIQSPRPAFGAATSSGPSRAAPTLPPACLATARSAAGLPADGSGAGLYQARLRWRGQAAEVVAFPQPGGLSGVIVRTEDCSVLVVLPL
jgi:hypothetical protein